MKTSSLNVGSLLAYARLNMAPADTEHDFGSDDDSDSEPDTTAAATSVADGAALPAAGPELDPDIAAVIAALGETPSGVPDGIDGGEGVVKPHVVNGVNVLVDMAEAYAHRNKEKLAGYTGYEFKCKCSVVPRVGKDPTKATTRHSNMMCDLQPSSRYFETHVIVLHSKTMIPKLYPPPPVLPSEPRSAVRSAAWRAKWHAIAQWALVLHRPWNVDTHVPGPLNFRALVAYCKACKAGTFVAEGDDLPVGKFVGHGRFHWMVSLVTPIAPSVADRATVMDRRASNRDMWTAHPEAPNHDEIFDRGLRPNRRRVCAGEGDGEGDEGGGAGGDGDARTSAEVTAESHLVDELHATRGTFGIGDLGTRAHEEYVELWGLSLLPLRPMYTAPCRRCSAQRLLNGTIATVKRLFPPQIVAGAGLAAGKAPRRVKVSCATIEDAAAMRCADTLLRKADGPGMWNASSSSSDDDDDDEGSSTASSDSEPRRHSVLAWPVEPEKPKWETLNHEQMPFYDKKTSRMREVKAWLDAGAVGKKPGTQQLDLLHAGPGAGKSRLTCAIAEYGIACGLRSIIVASLGHAAHAVGGTTAQSAMNIFAVPKVYKPPNLLTVRRVHGFPLTTNIIIEEISSFGAHLFNELDNFARTYMGEEHIPFGGLDVLLVGDFFQLPPVKDQSLVNSAVRFAVFGDAALTPREADAAAVFLQFSMYKLEVNMRAKVRKRACFARPRHRLDSCPRSQEDPDFATLLRGIRTAVPGARPVRDLFLPRIDDFVLTEQDVAADPDAWREAPVLVSTNALRLGIIFARNRDLAMRQGVPLVVWRIPLSPAVAESLGPARLEALYDNEPQMWGSYIQDYGCYLDKNVNVKLGFVNGLFGGFESVELGSPDSDANDAAVEQDDQARINAGAAGDIIEIRCPHAIQVEAFRIPVASVGSYSLRKKRTVIRIFANTAREISVYIPGVGQRKLKVMCHGVDPSIAATLYKAEGRTMERALAMFNKMTHGGVSFEEFLVWLSRTTYEVHAKILPLLPGETWDHLAGLHPPDNLIIYMAGFEKGSVFNVEDARVAQAALVALQPPTRAERKAAKAAAKTAAAAAKQAKQAATASRRAIVHSTVGGDKRKRADAAETTVPPAQLAAHPSGPKRPRNAVTLAPGAASLSAARTAAAAAVSSESLGACAPGAVPVLTPGAATARLAGPSPLRVSATTHPRPAELALSSAPASQRTRRTLALVPAAEAARRRLFAASAAAAVEGAATGDRFSHMPRGFNSRVLAIFGISPARAALLHSIFPQAIVAAERAAAAEAAVNVAGSRKRAAAVAEENVRLPKPQPACLSAAESSAAAALQALSAIAVADSTAAASLRAASASETAIAAARPLLDAILERLAIAAVAPVPPVAVAAVAAVVVVGAPALCVSSHVPNLAIASLSDSLDTAAIDRFFDLLARSSGDTLTCLSPDLAAAILSPQQAELCALYSAGLGTRHLDRPVASAINVGNHYVYFYAKHVAGSTECEVDFLDPAGHGAERMRYAAGIVRWLEAERVRLRRPLVTYTVRVDPRDLTLQNDDISCGVFVCVYLYFRIFLGRWPTAADFGPAQHWELRAVILDAFVTGRIRIPIVGMPVAPSLSPAPGGRASVAGDASVSASAASVCGDGFAAIAPPPPCFVSDENVEAAKGIADSYAAAPFSISSEAAHTATGPSTGVRMAEKRRRGQAPQPELVPFSLSRFFLPNGSICSDSEFRALTETVDPACAAGGQAVTSFVSPYHNHTRVLRDDLCGLRGKKISGVILSFAADVFQAINAHATASLRAAAGPAMGVPLGPDGPIGLSRMWIFNTTQPPPTTRNYHGPAHPAPWWRSYHFIDVSLFDFLVFLCHVGGIHYTFLVLDLVGRCVHYYDSIHRFACADRDQLCCDAKTWLQSLSWASGALPTYGDAASWPTHIHDDGHSFPAQGSMLDADEGFTLGNDCACFALDGIASLARGKPFAFSQAGMDNRRRQLASMILHADTAPDAAGELGRTHSGCVAPCSPPTRTHATPLARCPAEFFSLPLPGRLSQEHSAALQATLVEMGLALPPAAGVLVPI